MRTSSLAATALLIVLFLGINMFSLSALRGIKLDASEGNIYTLSKGSRNIVASLDEKVRLKLFYSRDLARGEPTLAAYGVVTEPMAVRIELSKPEHSMAASKSSSPLRAIYIPARWLR